MGWPQYTYLALVFLSLGISIANHGQPETGKKNAWYSIIAMAIVLPLLWAGGFFG